MLGIWREAFLNLADTGMPGLSPIDNITPLKFGFMQITKKDMGLLYIWDEKNKVKGVIHRVLIPEGAPLIPQQNNFLPDYKWLQ